VRPAFLGGGEKIAHHLSTKPRGRGEVSCGGEKKKDFRPRKEGTNTAAGEKGKSPERRERKSSTGRKYKTEMGRSLGGVLVKKKTLGGKRPYRLEDGRRARSRAGLGKNRGADA